MFLQDASITVREIGTQTAVTLTADKTTDLRTSRYVWRQVMRIYKHIIWHFWE